MSLKEHWEQVYQEKDPTDVSWYQDAPALSLALIRELGLKKSDAIIDIGGGASVLVDRLLDEGHTDVTVLDISENALDHSRRRLGNRAARVKWVASDATAFALREEVCLWHDRAVFHFLTAADDRRKYREVLSRTLRPGGHVIIATFALDGPSRCSGLEVVRYDAAALLAEFGPEYSLVGEREESHVTPWDSVQKFVYFTLVRTVRGSEDS